MIEGSSNIGSPSSQTPEHSLLKQAREALARYRGLTGARLVESILPVEGTSLAEVISPDPEFVLGVAQPRYTRGVLVERKVEMSDMRALADYIQCCERLKKKIAADLELGHEREAASKQKEYEDILRHIREITHPGGGIKYFPSSDTKDYQRKFQAFKYLLRKLRISDPDVYHYLKDHVQTGVEFRWIESPD
ncbi:MAG: hypothetical protein K0B87_01785 [Candidatus Syntrophosphaera sp.]|nr:hypothetical protein [Candidatus Syntrophosphaera sp.]